MTNMEMDITYEVEVSGKTQPEYMISQSISAWLQGNLENLLDDDENPVFNQVNTGFNEKLKTFGKHPVCDVYVNNTEYSTTFNVTQPERVNTYIIFYMKGATNATYMRACKVHDYIMQEFIINDDFKKLTGIVDGTQILNSGLRVEPIKKVWGVMGTFELSHSIIQRM